MFTLIWVWINGWVNNREAGDLRRYRAHFDVIVMMKRRRLTSVWISSLKIRRSCTTANLYNGIHTHGKTVFVLECLPVDDWKWTKTMKTNFSVIHIHWVDNASDMATAMWVNIGSSNDLLPDGTKPLPEPILTSPWWGSIHLRTMHDDVPNCAYFLRKRCIPYSHTMSYRQTDDHVISLYRVLFYNSLYRAWFIKVDSCSDMSTTF